MRLACLSPSPSPTHFRRHTMLQQGKMHGARTPFLMQGWGETSHGMRVDRCGRLNDMWWAARTVKVCACPVSSMSGSERGCFARSGCRNFSACRAPPALCAQRAYTFQAAVQACRDAAAREALLGQHAICYVRYPTQCAWQDQTLVVHTCMLACCTVHMSQCSTNLFGDESCE